MRTYWVYILANQSRGLYVGVTSDLSRRVYEHRHRLRAGFASRYNMIHLVYYEATTNVGTAIAREKQLKSWSRKKKIALIRAFNPCWADLGSEWC